ncbi:retrovirus-related pol polyprotein from transposon TNT 1-94 [Tanacetum coccineum]
MVSRSTKLKFDNIRDLILGEDIVRRKKDKTSEEYSNSLLSAEDKGRGTKQDRGQKHNRSRSKSKKRGQSKYRQDITCWNCNQKGHFQNQCSKPVTSRDKEVNMVARDYDDALVCWVKNTIDDRIMVFMCASFHATLLQRELQERLMKWLISVGRLIRKGTSRPSADQQCFSSEIFIEYCMCRERELDAETVPAKTPQQNGYGSDEMGYRFWDSKSHKVVRSRDVTFNDEDSLMEPSCNSSSNLTKAKSDSNYSEPRWELSFGFCEGPKKQWELREVVVEDQIKKTLKIEHPSRREVSRLHSYEDPLESPRLRLVLSIVATENLHLEQLDVKTSFLYGDLDEDIYMTQLGGFQSAGKEENLVCKLKKSLYGLKQASRQWLRHDKDQEVQEVVVSRIRDEGFRLRKADSRHEHHQR